MKNKDKNLELGIDSSLSYCSITLFKNKKILWDKVRKCDYGHEKVLSKLLEKLLQETKIRPDYVEYLHLNNGPARFTAIRNCHALMKGFFFGHKIKILSYSLFEHYYLGVKEKISKNLICIVDTNRRDLAIQKINNKGKLIGKTKTHLVDDNLLKLLNEDCVLIGNGLDKLKTLSDYKFINKKNLGVSKLQSNFFINDFYNKKASYKFPKINYPYSPLPKN
tara:strand:- start:5931 stop:6593 length:663 start_codon:yes stop_codon:yes gene_type:complete